MLGGGSPAEPCRAATVKLLPCRAWDKAQNYTDRQGEDNLSLARTTAKAVFPQPVPWAGRRGPAVPAHTRPSAQPCFRPGCASSAHLQLLVLVVLLMCSDHKVHVFLLHPAQRVLKMPGGKVGEMR